jgi:hypothetical protein
MKSKGMVFISAVALAVIIALSPHLGAEAPKGPSIVQVKGTELIVQKRLENGSLDQPKAYLMKGVTWSPATRAPDDGPDPANAAKIVPYGFFFDWPGRAPQGRTIFRSWLIQETSRYYKTDIPLMKEMNANTVRVYDGFGESPEVNKAILDEFYKNGIMVIMAIAASKDDIETYRYLRIVKMCKDHPAILVWSLGNEWNLEYNKYYGYETVADAATATEEAAKTIKKIDRNHPVSSCLGDRFEDKDPKNTVKWIVKKCPDVDVWGLNIYRGMSLGDLFKRWQATTTKPLYISEFGIDSFATKTYKVRNEIYAADIKGGEDQDAQATWNIKMWNDVAKNLSAVNPKNVCIGGIVHSFNDSLWKVGSYHVLLGDLINYNDPQEGTSYSTYNPEGLIMKGSFPDDVANEEYFGIFDADRKPKLIFYELQKFYKNL